VVVAIARAMTSINGGAVASSSFAIVPNRGLGTSCQSRLRSAGIRHMVEDALTVSTAVPERDIKLRDGRIAHLRPVEPSDQAELLQAFERIDAEARYMRFMHSVREPNVERLRTVLASLPQAGEGVVATVPAADGYDIAGSAVCFMDEGASCEFAITVTPQFAHAGLGSALMQALIAAARARGLGEMVGFVLAINEPMLRLARKLGFTIGPDPEDAALKLCRLALR